jgi:hypothetical protein
VSALAAVAWIIGAVVLTWAVMLARASARISRLRAELARLHEEMRAEIQHWQEESARAKVHAAQVARDAATWAVAWKQGREDVFSTVPLLIAAQERLAGMAGLSLPGAEPTEES